MTNIKRIILTGKDGRPSMKNVYSKMTTGDLIVRRNIPGAVYYRHYTNNKITSLNKVVAPKFNDVSIIIRWGTQEVLNDIKDAVIYNKSKALALVSNKFESRKAMFAAGVNVPMNVDNNTAENLISYPVIARPFKHSKGKNFVTLPNRNSFLAHYQTNKNGWYYSNFIDKVKEFRVHTASGKCLNLLEKPNPGPGQIAWNRAQGNDAFVSVKWEDYPLPVVLEGLKACKALGADFLGVDVILDKQGKAWVLEGNSSPTLNSSEYSCTRYSKYFEWLMRSPEYREHWDFTQFKSAESFAWKNFQLEETKS